MASTEPISAEQASSDALFIMKSIRENATHQRSNKLADVKEALEGSVALEFDSYFFFLRKYHYIAMDREAQLKITESGEAVLDGISSEKFSSDVHQFFVAQPDDGDIDEGTLLTSGPPPSFSSPISSAEQTPMSTTTSRASKKPPPPPADEAAAPALPAPLAPPAPPAPPMSGHTHIPAIPLPLSAAVSMAPPAPATAKGQDLDARYQKNEQIGAGPLGTVFRGRHNALGVEVCVKELKDIFGYFSFLQRGDVIKRLKKELCAQAQVRHPGVVQVLDQNTDVARPYFVMEVCKGNLKEKLEAAAGKGVSVPLALRYFLQLAYALRAAHQHGLTHHNIKPENVLFDAYGNAKLGDFGLSRVIEVDASRGMPQVFVGTGGMGYMSPELIARSKDPGQSSDVYGLGILLFEMLTGQIPGRRSPLPSEINAECPAKMDAIFDKMTHDRKESRYPDFDAVFDDFYSAFGDKTFLSKGDLLLWSQAPSAQS